MTQQIFRQLVRQVAGSFKSLSRVLNGSLVYLVLAAGLFPVAGQAAPVDSAQATVLSFSDSSLQNTVTSLTSDSNTLTTGWVNATYDASHGMVVPVAPGTFSVGFGSYVPGHYTGPGTMYLHRVLITDQTGALILDESFDDWTLVSSETTGSVTRSEYNTADDISWETYADTSDFYTGGGAAFAATDSSGDAGMVYPLDGGGPFSVLIRTLVDVPAGVTELRIDVDWRYNVSIFGGSEARLFAIGLQRGTVDPEFLFSFSTPIYTVTYDGNTSTGGTVPTDIGGYDEGDTITVLGNTGGLVKTGYTFAGWNTAADGSGVAYAPAVTFIIGEGNVVLYAQWTAHPTYTVTYDGNTSTSGTVPTDIGGYDEGDTITVLGNTGGLVKTGYTFAGWNTAANGSGVAYDPAVTFIIGEGNVVLYAQWTASPTYTVAYDGNTSTGGLVPIDTEAYEEGRSVTVRGNTGALVKTGYTFAGWNTAANGTGTAYAAGSLFQIGTTGITLYAQWNDIVAPEAPTISVPATMDHMPTISGTAEAGSTVELFRSGVLVGTVVADGTGVWTYTPAGVWPPGVHSITATATDAAGNKSSVSTAVSVTVLPVPVSNVINTFTPNTGVISDPVITPQGTVDGGTLAGEVRNEGYIHNVHLSGGSHVDGGTLGGTITGTSGNPAVIGNAIVQTGASLENVIIGRGTVLETGVQIGSNVKFETDAGIPGSLDLTAALRQLDWADGDLRSVVNLDDDILLPADGSDPMTIIRAIQLLNEYEPAGNEVNQSGANGEILIITVDSSSAVLPVRVSMAEPDDVEGTYINRDGDIVFVTANRRVVLAYPVLQDKPTLEAALNSFGLFPVYDERANIRAFHQDAGAESALLADGRIASSSALTIAPDFYYSGRPDVTALPAYRGDEPGVQHYAVPGLPGASGISILFEDAEGRLMEQEIVPMPADWPLLRETLLGLSDMSDVRIDPLGIISVLYNGTRMQGRSGYRVYGGADDLAMPGRVVFLPVGDVNGNGQDDYMVIYPNGDRQALYIFPAQQD